MFVQPQTDKQSKESATTILFCEDCEKLTFAAALKTVRMTTEEFELSTVILGVCKKDIVTEYCVFLITCNNTDCN